MKKYKNKKKKKRDAIWMKKKVKKSTGKKKILYAFKHLYLYFIWFDEKKSNTIKQLNITSNSLN